jgi:hypothetical protein
MGQSCQNGAILFSALALASSINNRFRWSFLAALTYQILSSLTCNRKQQQRNLYQERKDTFQALSNLQNT